MRTVTFAKRTLKEILRDPLNLFFGLGFPAVLILLLTAIQSNIPVNTFPLDGLVPGMTVFGLSFITLFSATLIAKDRESAFLTRLYATPMRSYNFILGYTLPILPVALMQSAFCFLIGIILGQKITINMLYATIFNIPISLFFIGLGLLFGSVLNTKQVGGICGALLTNLTAWLSGIWFSLELVGGVFKKIAYVLPFVHAVEIEKAVFLGNFSNILPHFLWILGYMFVVAIVSVLLFLKQMKKA